MPTLGGDLLTLSDIAKRTDPDGSAAMIAELLHQTNPILDDIPWMEGNLATGHRSTIRTGLPTVSLRRLNEGVASSKSTTAQITDGSSIVEAWSTVDERVLKLSRNPAATRMDEASAFIESMGQTVAELFFYGDEAQDDKEFNGLSVRYASLSGDTSDNVVNCEGAGAHQTSVWLVGWGKGKVMGMYPRGTSGGLRHTDHGLRPVMDNSSDPAGAKFSAYEDQWTWDCGLVVADWRYVVRVGNIDVPDLQAVDTTQKPLGIGAPDYSANVLLNMVRATHRVPNLQACRPVWYMNRTAFEGLDVQHTAAGSNNAIKHEDVPGVGPRYTFRGIPIRICDQLLSTEAALT